MSNNNGNEYSSQLSAAKDRLRKKLQKLDLKTVGITEYNQRYLGNKISNIDSQLERYGNLLSICFANIFHPIQETVIVDYGGGPGVLSLFAKELGVKEVIYVDIYDGSCNDIQIISKALELPLDHIICGDVDDLISYVQGNSINIDVIVSYDVLEHIYDVEDHFRKLSSLTSDFKIVYASGANIKNPMTVYNLKKGHIKAEYQNQEKVFGKKERDSLLAYFDIRKDIIRSYSPELDSNEVDKIALQTRGLHSSDIKKCLDEYKLHNCIHYINHHPTNTCDPYTGNWCEKLIDIEGLESSLKSYGYSVEIMSGYWYAQSPPKKIVTQTLNFIMPLLGKHHLRIAPYFIVVADYTPTNRSNNHAL